MAFGGAVRSERCTKPSAVSRPDSMRPIFRKCSTFVFAIIVIIITIIIIMITVIIVIMCIVILSLSLSLYIYIYILFIVDIVCCIPRWRRRA